MIVLKSTFRVIEILGKTQAAGYDKLEVGDIITIEMPLKNTGQRGKGGGGCYAQEAIMRCETKGISASKSVNQTANTLAKFFKLQEGNYAVL